MNCGHSLFFFNTTLRYLLNTVTFPRCIIKYHIPVSSLGYSKLTKQLLIETVLASYQINVSKNCNGKIKFSKFHKKKLVDC